MFCWKRRSVAGEWAMDTLRSAIHTSAGGAAGFHSHRRAGAGMSTASARWAGHAELHRIRLAIAAGRKAALCYHLSPRLVRP